MNSFNRGGVLVMSLVLVAMFVVIFLALSGLISQQHRETVLQAHDELAFQAAEAGLNYARWRLAHEPDNFTDETRELNDQLAGKIGEYDVQFDQAASGSSTVVIQSVGRTEAQPSREVDLTARYGIPSLAQYAFVTNADVWYGGTIVGPVHANGGIRMDGNSNSLMTSAQETYECQPHHGCNSPFETKDGVWGSGTTQELWDYPVPPVDYNGLSLDLLEMKSLAQDAGTYYSKTNKFGYQLVFNSDNTYTISEVTALTSPVWSWTAEDDWEFTSHDAGTVSLVETAAVPSGGVIYVEDNLWVSGDIRDRVSVAAGRFPDNPSKHKDIIINGSISYDGVRDGTRVFGAVAQRHVLIPWSGAPSNLTLDGAYIAQQGRFGRRYYPQCCGSQTHALKNSMTRFGMIASNLVPVTAWVDGGGQVISGYQTGTSEYDPNLIYGPPPYFPTTGEYEFISWEEAQ